MKRAWIALSLILTSFGALRAQTAVEEFGTYIGPGAIDGKQVGPGPDAGSERLYLAYMYVERTIDLVSIDPANGKWKVFENPAKSEYGAIMTLGPDGNIYLGTRPHAHLYQFNPRTEQYTDLGQPAAGEAYIWGLTVASDGKIYGCTYPSAHLVRYDTALHKSEDLGRMDPKEQYGLSVAASDDGFVYEGIGTAAAHLVAYQISTGEHRDILPQAVANLLNQEGEGKTAMVHRGDDGKIYAVVGKQNFLVKGWTASAIPESEAHPAASTTRLKDGRTLSVEGNEIAIAAGGAGTEAGRIPYTYPGREGEAFRVGAGPDGRIYGSSILPFHLFTLDPKTKQIHDFGSLGHGEAYSLVPYNHKLYMAAYGGENKTPLMAYDPSRPFAPGSLSDSNPLFVTYDGSDTGWRPEAMIVGPDGKFYIGSVAGYGSVNGPLTIFDPVTNHVSKITEVVTEESVVSLAATKHLIAGGTSIFGGGGSHPTQHEAKLFLWDPLKNQKVYETVPVANANAVTDMLTLPDGRIMGVATGIKPDVTNPSLTATSGSGALFVFDPQSRKISYTVPFPLQGVITNSAALGPDGAVWGLVHDGIFRFDLKTHQLQLAVKTPKTVTAGFALLDNSIYFASGPTVYRYALQSSHQTHKPSAGVKK